MTTEYMAYLLKNDSVHGRFKGDITVDGTNLIINGWGVQTFSFKDPSQIPWGASGVEFVAETSGALKENVCTPQPLMMRLVPSTVISPLNRP